MKIAILDVVPEVYWAADEGQNDGIKFKSMLAETGIDADLTVHCIPQDDWPDRVEDYDAYLISGSPCGANESYNWSGRFTLFVDSIIRQKRKLVGVCFGHQFIARHLGGTVERSDSGWLIGLHPVAVTDHQQWMTPRLADSKIYYFNQDQITALPDAATHIGTAPNCRYAAWCVDDRIFCLQGHPEQPIGSMRNFIDATRDSIDHGVLDAAEQSMRDSATDAGIWANWIRNFLIA